MARKILTALTATSFMLLAFSLPSFAQERQVNGNRTIFGPMPQELRLVVGVGGAEKIRRELLTAYDESEALVKYLAEYDFVHQSEAMKDYEVVRQQVADERLRVEQMSAAEFERYLYNLPYARNLNNVIQLARSIRTDTKFQDVLQKVERYSQAKLLKGNGSGNGLNVRGSVAAPAYITPDCDFDAPNNYPSGVDLGIANAVALALSTAVEVQSADFTVFCAVLPNPFRAIFAVLKGIAVQVANALKAVAVDGAYCESIRTYVEESLTPFGGQNALLMNDNFYLKFMYKAVKSDMAKATLLTIPINCGQTLLDEVDPFFDGSDNFTGTGPQRVEAFKKLRAAYHNIGASACVQ